MHQKEVKKWKFGFYHEYHGLVSKICWCDWFVSHICAKIARSCSIVQIKSSSYFSCVSVVRVVNSSNYLPTSINNVVYLKPPEKIGSEAHPSLIRAWAQAKYLHHLSIININIRSRHPFSCTVNSVGMNRLQDFEIFRILLRRIFKIFGFHPAVELTSDCKTFDENILLHLDLNVWMFANGNRFLGYER